MNKKGISKEESEAYLKVYVLPEIKIRFMKKYNKIADSLPPRDGSIKNTIERLKKWFKAWGSK